jgi:hypothetical protein
VPFQKPAHPVWLRGGYVVITPTGCKCHQSFPAEL